MPCVGIEMENEMFNKTLLNKDIELRSLAKEHHESKERIKNIRSDRNKIIQENQDLQLIDMAKEVKMISLGQKQVKLEKEVNE